MRCRPALIRSATTLRGPLIGVSYGGDSIARWLDTQPDAVDCIEVVAEDFYKRNHPHLASLATLCPLIVRAVSLSLGTPGPLHRDRLTWLGEVVAIANPLYVVHPLGFSRTDEIDLGRPIPISLNGASLAVVAEHVREVMQTCRKPLLVQNITAPLRIQGTIAEPDFLNRLCEEAGCRLLVDVTALLVDSRNHRFDPLSWLRNLDAGWVAGVHIAGCLFRDGRWQDVHQGPIDEDAWGLVDILVQRSRPDALIIEVQEASSGIDQLEREIERLRLIASNGGSDAACHATKSSSVGRVQPGQRKSAPRRSSGRTLATESNGRTSRGRSRRRSNVTKSGVPADGRSGRIDVAADACLYVLDREGVFFSESRQEVYLFNTAATLIWCLVEQGLSVNAVIDAYREAFGLARSEATAHVAAALHQWFGLGYIRDPALPIAPEIPLTTALARLLTNPQLRSQFKESPQTMATALRVGAADFDSFVSLEPDEVDRQAEEIAELRSVWRYRGGAGRSTSREATTVAVDPDLLEAALRARVKHPRLDRSRCYRLLTTMFCIRLPSDRLDGDVHAALAHLHAAEQPPDVVIDVGEGYEGWIVFEGPTPLKYCRSVEEVVPAVKQMVREISVDRHRFLIKIHAAVVFFGPGCVLLPGAAGSGKTTLTAALLRSGGKYFSDEVALLEEGTLAVRPVPLALTIKQGGVEPLRRLYPELAALPQHMREDHQSVRYLPPPSKCLFDDGQAHQIRWIVFPRYDPTVETALVPLDRPSGLRRLLDESLVLPDLLDRSKVDALVRWMRGVQCFELPMSSLETAVALFRHLKV